jgi:hypothetical protein
MFIYHVHRNGQGSWQEQEAVVVIATDEEHARDIASERCGDEGPYIWGTKHVTVDYLGTARAGLTAGMICRDYAEV